jgi:hypothetical protein
MSLLRRQFPLFRALVILALALGDFLVSTPAEAGSQEVAEEIPVVLDEVTSAFPQGLNFHLEVDLGSSIARADLLFSVGVHPTLIQTSAELDELTDTSIEHFVDLLYLGVPTGVTLSYHWHLQLDDGSFVETPTSQTDWFDDRFDWAAFETEDVTLYGYAGNDAFYEQAVQVAQDSVTALQQRFSAPERPEPLRIWLYESQSDLSGAMSPNSRDWIGGVSYARYSLIAAVVPWDSDYSILRVIPHEVAHQIIYDTTQNPFNYPATWLDEGIAMAVQTVDLEGLDEMVEDAYVAGTLPSVQSLISEFGSDGDSTRLAYASSYSIVKFIEQTMGSEAIAELVSAYAEGKSHDETLRSVLEIDSAELNRQWRTHIESQIAA